MGKTTYKQDSFPLFKISRDLILKFIVHISHDILYRNLLVLCLDGIPLYIGRIIGHRRLVHEGCFHRLPVFGGLLQGRISG